MTYSGGRPGKKNRNKKHQIHQRHKTLGINLSTQTRNIYVDDNIVRKDE